MCIDADVVVVSIQYRLGAFGQVNFAALCEEDLFDSNCGTWDQVAAVNWVVENIASFGGDPACITLMGESAGGSSVLTLITTPYLRGKIKRAVLGSPAPFLIHSPENGKLAAEEVLKCLKLPKTEIHRLRELPAEELIKAVGASIDNYVNTRPYLIPPGPVVDGDLIPEHPYDAVMHGAADGIQILIGTTADEGTMFARGKSGDIFPTAPEQLKIFWDANPLMDREAILKLYETFPEKKLYHELGKEIVFHLPTVALAHRLAQVSDVYMYRFDYAYPVMRMLGLGAVHATDSVLIFGGERIGILKFYALFSGKTGNGLAKEVHDRWCRFIASGDPNLPGDTAWPKYSDRQATYILNHKRTVAHEPAADLQKVYGTIRPYGN
jgi:para-nitrobenzyl esterase